ncbi:MAG: hypothetical protein AB1726_01560 [Planctomycetota bacterium]
MRHRRTTHLTRGFTLLVLGGLAYQGIRVQLVPATFGELGTYRAAALAEIAAEQPLFQGRDACNECHEDIVDTVRKDTHRTVNCEDCHGPAQLHVAYQMGEDDEGITAEMALLPKEKDRALCLLCHRRLRARPVSFPQIDPDEHVAFLRRDGAAVDCVECHSPHEPIFLLTDAESARLHPVIRECFHCHDPVPETPVAEVEGHVPVFQCIDCHGELVEDFEKRPHSIVSCATCHLYTQVSDTADRIFKNGNVKFCLLCHEEKPFKDPAAIPLVRWPAHLDEEEIAAVDREKTCIQCHWEKIHLMSWGETAEETDR